MSLGLQCHSIVGFETKHRWSCVAPRSGQLHFILVCCAVIGLRSMHDTNLENWHKSTLFQLVSLGVIQPESYSLAKTFRSREANHLQWACLGPVESPSKAEQLAQKQS